MLTYFENILRLLYGVGLLFFARHLLDAEDFADFAFYLAVAVVCYGVCKFSFDAYAVREFVLHPAESLPVLWRLIAIRGGGSVLVVGLVVFGFFVFGKYDAVFSILIVCQIVRAVDSVEWLLRAEEKLVLQALVRLASMLVVIAALFFLLFFVPVVCAWHIVFVQACEWGVILLAYSIVFLIKRKIVDPTRNLDPVVVGASVRKIVSGAMYVHVGFFLFLLYGKLDQFFLKWLLGSEVYGVYMVAARLTESAVILVISLNMFFYPKLVVAHQKSAELFSAMIRRYSFVFLLMAVFVVLCVWIMRFSYVHFPVAVRNIMPYELLEILSWMIFSLVPVFFFGLRSSFFTIIDEPRNIILGAGFGFASATLFGIPLMYSFGAFGGVACVFLVAFFSLFVSNFFSISGRVYLKVVFNG